MQAHVTQAVDEYKSAYPLTLKFDYQFTANRGAVRHSVDLP